jgi:two-component system chemotaxis response regulator CheY
MSSPDGELAEKYADGCREQMAGIDPDLLALKKTGAEIADEVANRPGESVISAGKGSPRPGSAPRILLVEDDFASRLLLHTFLSDHGECHIAVNGREAVEALASGYERGQRYDLICMDIMMPEMDGREAVRQIRAFEGARGVAPHRGVKIVMTTAVNDIQEIMKCFGELCDAYLTKPIDLNQLLKLMTTYGLVEPGGSV